VVVPEQAGPPGDTGRATTWRLAGRTLTVGSRPLLMGIVNATPDSFSDGGRHLGVEAAVAHGLALAESGADILDVGGESTRPFSTPVDAEEEWRRVGEVVRRLARETALPVSIDTSKASVASRALDAGCEIINDVTALTGDTRMLEVARASAAGLCAMHMQGSPATMQIDPRYEDVVREVHDSLAACRERLEAAGIGRDRICLDPGIGFGKTHEHNRRLVAEADAFLDLGTPILVGHSRKGFIRKSIEARLGRPAEESEVDAATAGIACHLARLGIQVIRVHAVSSVRATVSAFLEASSRGTR
jgi:dihydropteroate synthase